MKVNEKTCLYAIAILVGCFVWYKILIPALAATGYYWCALLAIMLFATPIVTGLFAVCYYIFNKFVSTDEKEAL